MPTCPYCGADVVALKNHVRLSSGNGHGPHQEYPDDFNDGVRTDGRPRVELEAIDGQGNEGSDTGTSVSDEQDAPGNDDVQSTADQSGCGCGEQTGADGQQSDGGGSDGQGIVPAEDRVEDPDSASSQGEERRADAGGVAECPECGCTDRRDADEHLAEYGDQLTEFHTEALAAFDYVCLTCGACYNGDGSMPDRFEDVDPEDTPPSECEECESVNYVSASHYLDRYGDQLDEEHTEALHAGEIVCLDCGAVCG